MPNTATQVSVSTPLGSALGDPKGPDALGLTPEAATAAHLGVKVQTLRKWAVQRKGPPRVKVGKRVFYRPEAIQRWLTGQERDPAAVRR